jgi:hypothetical protein
MQKIKREKKTKKVMKKVKRKRKRRQSKGRKRPSDVIRIAVQEVYLHAPL